MSDDQEIVSLEAFRLAKKPPEPTPPDFKEDMLATLKKAVADAETGQLRGFVIAIDLGDSSTVEVRGRVRGPDVLWLLERMKKAILP